MKKRLLLLTVLVVALVALLAISASAATIYKDAEGNTLYSYDYDTSTFLISNKQGVGFAKADAQGNALTWYITATATEGSDTVYTVASLITLGEAGSINSNGAYTFTSPVTNKNTVSVNFPDNAGIKSWGFNSFGGYNSRANNRILFVYCPNTLTTFANNPFQETPVIVVELDDETPITQIPQNFAHEARNLTEINIPTSVEIINGNSSKNGTPFYNNHSLTKVTFASNEKLKEMKNACFQNCNSLISIDLPDSVTTIGNYCFASCTSLTEVSLPNSLVTIANHAFAWCTSLKVIRMGASFAYFNNTGDNSFTYNAKNVEEIYIPKTFYKAAPDTSLGYQVSYAFHGVSSNCKFFYCGTTTEFEVAKANFLTQKSATSNNGGFTNATIITYAEYLANPDNYATGRYVICGYNTCDAFYDEKHDLGDVNSCMAIASCDRECGYSVAPDFEGHSVVETLVYANGFDKSGVYNCICENAEYCTAIEGYALNEIKDPIITFKGYSNPETEAYLGINVGYFVDTLLLSEYTRITGESVTIGLFMVNGEIDVADIIDGKTLELADGAKGFSVKVINLNYSSISIEVRGFSKTGETEGSLGNYYTLKLVSAVVVTTTKDESTTTHFIQAGVDGADLETKTFNGFDFYLITADAVYGTPES